VPAAAGSDDDSTAAAPKPCTTLSKKDEVGVHDVASCECFIEHAVQVAAFAAFIGLDAEADADLMWIAEDAMLHPLPPGASASRAAYGMRRVTCNQDGVKRWLKAAAWCTATGDTT
jgi:hypothetical protein